MENNNELKYKNAQQFFTSILSKYSDNDDENYFPKSAKDVKKYYPDEYQTEAQDKRDHQVTDLLTEYVMDYKKSNTNKAGMKIALFVICAALIIGFSAVLIWVINIALVKDTVVAMGTLITVVLTYLTSLITILTIITKHLFPSEQDRNITEIVKVIQKNDLAHKQMNIDIDDRKATKN